MYFGLKYKLIITFITVQTVLTFCVGYYQYQQQWPLLVSQSKANHKNIAQQLVNTVSLSIEGNNYANIYLPTFISQLKSISSLVYLDVDGLSERQKKYQFSYHRDIGETWRNYYSYDYIASLNTRIEKLNNILLKQKSDSVKVSFLLKRALEEKTKYTSSLKHKNIIDQLSLPKVEYSDGSLIEGNWLLPVILPSTNSQGGSIKLIFDVSSLKSIQNTIIYSVILECVFTIIVISVFIILAIQWFIHPIEQLTEYLSHDIQKINVNRIPAITKNNEIGDLARKFQLLISNTSQHIEYIEEQSTVDTLTNLLNRRNFEMVADDLMLNAKRLRLVFSIIYIDIDNFKKYNDNYGHNKGDLALKKVATVLRNTAIRDDDYCFRFGGEEFVVLVINKEPKGALTLAKRICKNVENENIEHLHNDKYPQLTISVGVCSLLEYKENIQIKTALKAADQALYTAKNSGKNTVCQTIT